MSLDLEKRWSNYRKVVAAFHLKAYNQAMLVSLILPQLPPRDIHIIFDAYGEHPSFIPEIQRQKPIEIYEDLYHLFNWDEKRDEARKYGISFLHELQKGTFFKSASNVFFTIVSFEERFYSAFETYKIFT